MICFNYFVDLKAHMSIHLPDFLEEDFDENNLQLVHGFLKQICTYQKVEKFIMLLGHVRSRKLYSEGDWVVSYKDTKQFTAFQKKIGESSPSEFKVGPPNSIASLLHWTVLHKVIAGFTRTQQEALKSFRILITVSYDDIILRYEM